MANPRKRKAAIARALQAACDAKSQQEEEKINAVINNIVTASDEEVSQEEWLENRASELAEAISIQPEPTVTPEPTPVKKKTVTKAVASKAKTTKKAPTKKRARKKRAKK